MGERLEEDLWHFMHFIDNTSAIHNVHGILSTSFTSVFTVVFYIEFICECFVLLVPNTVSTQLSISDVKEWNMPPVSDQYPSSTSTSVLYNQSVSISTTHSVREEHSTPSPHNDCHSQIIEICAMLEFATHPWMYNYYALDMHVCYTWTMGSRVYGICPMSVVISLPDGMAQWIGKQLWEVVGAT